MMRCPPPPTDWALVIMWGLLFFGIGITAGKEWGERGRKPEPPRDP